MALQPADFQFSVMYSNGWNNLAFPVKFTVSPPIAAMMLFTRPS